MTCNLVGMDLNATISSINHFINYKDTMSRYTVKRSKCPFRKVSNFYRQKSNFVLTAQKQFKKCKSQTICEVQELQECA